MDYKVLRPPLSSTYELPSRDTLLKMKSGDLVKVTLQVADDRPERMWVTLDDCSDQSEWTGRIDTSAAQNQTAASLPVGKLIRFHPLDIITTE